MTIAEGPDCLGSSPHCSSNSSCLTIWAYLLPQSSLYPGFQLLKMNGDAYVIQHKYYYIQNNSCNGHNLLMTSFSQQISVSIMLFQLYPVSRRWQFLLYMTQIYPLTSNKFKLAVSSQQYMEEFHFLWRFKKIVLFRVLSVTTLKMQITLSRTRREEKKWSCWYMLS